MYAESENAMNVPNNIFTAIEQSRCARRELQNTLRAIEERYEAEKQAVVEAAIKRTASKSTTKGIWVKDSDRDWGMISGRKYWRCPKCTCNWNQWREVCPNYCGVERPE